MADYKRVVGVKTLAAGRSEMTRMPFVSPAKNEKGAIEIGFLDLGLF